MEPFEAKRIAPPAGPKLYSARSPGRNHHPRNGNGAAVADLERQLDALRQEREQLDRAVFDAAQVQRRLMAPRQRRREQFEIAGEIFPWRRISGDFLASFDIGGHTVLAIGDIGGKDLAAGMWFTHLVGLCRILSGSLPSPAAVAAAINRHLAALEREPPVTTLFLAWLEPRSGELTYCNAGHPAPLLQRRDGWVEWLNVGGPILGAIPGAAFVNGVAVLNPGDFLLGYSDGILECCNTLDEPFGLHRLLAAARSATGRSASSLLFSVLGAAQDFAAGRERTDDLAVLVVRRLPEVSPVGAA